jgi:microcompartment protein CcmL/EutN
MREELAVGLIETRGLVAAIEACDAALKSADVKLISIDRVDAGLMTVKIVGDVAAVQSAVDAGQMAAARVGTLVAAHVIPRPDPGLHEELIYVEVRPRKKSQSASLSKTASGSANTAASTAQMSNSAELSAVAKSVSPRLEEMTVQELRRYARTLPNFPIRGREISRASKETLLHLLHQFSSR